MHGRTPFRLSEDHRFGQLAAAQLKSADDRPQFERCIFAVDQTNRVPAISHWKRPTGEPPTAVSQPLMTAPNLTIIAEPAESSSIVYGALAGKTSNDPSNGQLSLILSITNNESSQVLLKKVTVSFVGQPNVNSSSITAPDFEILSTQTRVFAPATNIILPVPAPGALKLELSCLGFTDPATLGMPLAEYNSPADEGGYAFPAKSTDLNDGEYWTGRSALHDPAAGGTQLFAYDLAACAFDSASNGWRTSAPGTDASNNENYYAWGKPIYAMAHGVVVQFRDKMAANTPPAFPSPMPDPIEGNHFYIQHGDDLALYAHLQAGKLNPLLTSGPNADGTGAKVIAGQFLGLCGNSGRSSEPHLHLQVNRTTTPWSGPPRPLPFKDIYVLDLSVVPDTWPPNQDAPWNAASAQALPNVTSAIWPGKLKAGKKGLGRWAGPLAWAWIMFIGGLMITPGGISCPRCGPALTNLLAIVSITLGVLGFALRAISNRATAKQRVARSQIDVKGDTHTESTVR